MMTIVYPCTAANKANAPKARTADDSIRLNLR